jgi:lipopolysaccharide export system protein LptA
MKGEGEGAGRRIQGEIVDVTLAPDGTLTSVSARPGAEPEPKVRLDLPATGDAPARSITARTLDGTGQPGKGLTQTTFTGGVLYEEHALRSKAAAADKQTGMRTARSERLQASLADDAVTDAVFSGDTTFEDAGLKACAAQADYNPQKGTLALSGATKAGAPMVADEQVAIEAPKIDVALDTRRMTALGSRTEKLTTFMRSPRAQRCKPSTERPKSQQGASNVPGLFKSDVPTTVIVVPDKSAAGVPSLVYDSQKGLAIYSGGRATLEQDDASIVADRLSLDQNKADLTATGSAVTRLRIDDKISQGSAYEVSYVDATRKLTYSTQPKSPRGEVSLRSEQDSVIRAGNIVVTLAAKENKAETMTARGNVRAVEGPQSVTGATLEYTASDDRFKVKGDGSRPAAAASLEDGRCRISTGELITFGKGSSNVTAEGEQRRSRTEPAKAGACTPPAPPTVPTR